MVMKTYHSPIIGLAFDPEGYTIGELLSALSENPDCYRRLAGFARLRLRSVTTSRQLQQHFAAVTAEDLVQEALLKLLLGEHEPTLGRHLKTHNRTSLEAFVSCVKGVINSDLNTLVKAACFRCDHVFTGNPEHEPGAIDPVEPHDAAGLLSRRDLHRTLFAKLYGRIQNRPMLLRVVQDWEERFLDDDRIGDDGMDRKLAFRIRKLAREIIAELAAEVSPAVGDGREMLL